jgi:hypothetical protein
MNMRRCRTLRTLIPLPLVVALVALAACAAPATRTQPLPDGRGSAPADEHTWPDPLDLAAAHVEAIDGRAAVEAVRGYHATGTEGIVGQGIGATVQEWVRPGEGWRKRWDVEDFGRLEHGYDGRVAWLVRPDRPADAVRDEKYREAAASRAVLHPETDLIGHLGSAVVEVRRNDGHLVRELWSAAAAAREVGWVEPEQCSATAADGETRLHGLLFKPADFDPTRKYLVVAAATPSQK